MAETVEEASPFQRLVLLALLDLEREDATPAYSFAVRERCVERLDALAGDRFGGVTREEVLKALAALAADGAVREVEREDESPVGKGRPGYEPAVDPAPAREAAEGAAAAWLGTLGDDG